jgi:beta-1,4-mannosyl-glycoprotein beta-1,4-N-acetylglucosaminyltransferase
MEEVSGKLLSITGDFPEIADENRKWLGTKVTSLRNIPTEGIVRLRDIIKPEDPRSVRVSDGGWHFSYMGGLRETYPIKRMGVKIEAAAHQEYNDKETIAETMDKLILGQDIFGRDARFERVEIDDSFPEYIREHLKEYDYLVMPPITAFSRFTHKVDITAGRFLRKAVRWLSRRLGSKH